MTTSHYLPQRSTSQRSGNSESEPEKRDTSSQTHSREERVHLDNIPPPEYTTNNVHTDNVYHDEKDSGQYLPTPLMRREFRADEQEQHELALEELTRRPATPPPFPSTLPQRLEAFDQNTARQKRRKLIATTLIGMIIFTLIIIIIILGTLLGIAKQSKQPPTNMPVFPLNSNQTAATVTATMTIHDTNTTTIIQTISASTLVTITTISATTSTTSTTSQPTSTSPPDECTNSLTTTSTINLSISPLFCTFLSPCNTTLSPSEQQTLQCRDFCRININSTHDGITFANTNTNQPKLCSGIDSFLGPAKSRATECCGTCGCF